jgi:hypothetical protein
MCVCVYVRAKYIVCVYSIKKKEKKKNRVCICACVYVCAIYIVYRYSIEKKKRKTIVTKWVT